MCVHKSINTNKKEIINLTQNAESDIDILNFCPHMESENIRDICPETFDLKSCISTYAVYLQNKQS